MGGGTCELPCSGCWRGKAGACLTVWPKQGAGEVGPAAELKGLCCLSCFHLSFLTLLQGTPSSILPGPFPERLSLSHHQLSHAQGLECGARSQVCASCSTVAVRGTSHCCPRNTAPRRGDERTGSHAAVQHRGQLNTHPFAFMWHPRSRGEHQWEIIVVASDAEATGGDAAARFDGAKTLGLF